MVTPASDTSTADTLVRRGGRVRAATDRARESESQSVYGKRKRAEEDTECLGEVTGGNSGKKSKV